jgi:hypothetical protein
MPESGFIKHLGYGSGLHEYGFETLVVSLGARGELLAS